MSSDLERSLKDRIRAIAKSQERVFNDVWKALCLERFLVRLARSNELDRFVFKGGFLLSKYLRLGRETADLDFSLRLTEGSAESVGRIIDAILTVPYDDGFSFLEPAVEEVRHPHMDYPGYDVSLVACLGRTKTKIRVDLGIGDTVVPERKTIALLALNDKPLFESEISMQVYPLSYIFAEKLEAIVYRGGTNSRMKDFYDLLALSNLVEFDPCANADVIKSVFAHRGTTLPRRLEFDKAASENLSRSWKRFVRSLEEEFQQNVPVAFAEVVKKIDQILDRL